jgi:hypothetical protein
MSPSTHRVFHYGGDRHGAIVYPLGDSPGVAAFMAAQLDATSKWESVRP